MKLPSRLGTLFVCESLLIVLAVGVAAYVRLGRAAWEQMWSVEGVSKALLIAVVCQLCLFYGRLYEVRTIADPRKFTVRMLQAIGASAVTLAILYFWFPALTIGRGMFTIAVAGVFVTVMAWRLIYEWLLQVGGRERLLLVGTGPMAVRLARELYDQRELGVEIVGFVDADVARVGAPVFNPAVVGVIEDIPALVNNHTIDRVVVSLSDARGQLPMEKLLGMRLRDNVRFDHLASVYEEYTGKIAVENLRPSWLVFAAGFSQAPLLRGVKRAVDFYAAGLGLIALSPVMLLSALLIRLTSRGPVFYHQERVGKDGVVFTLHKFRSMRVDAEAETGAVWSQEGDERVTHVGQVLRRTRIDELPQLWNVLKGEMSLVGPRPERPEFVTHLIEEIPFYGQRHVVKPGVTGWAQVRYRYGSSREDALEKLQYDLYYIKNISIALDLFIIFKTIQTVLTGRGE